MFAFAIITLLLATLSLAADVCPPGQRHFKIHPYGHADLCVSTNPDFYMRPPYYNNTGQLDWVAIVLRPCNGSNTQVWKWYDEDHTLPGAALLNTQNPPPDLPRPGGIGLVLRPFQYRFPVTSGSQVYAIAWGPANPMCRWQYTTDYTLVNGFKDANGRDTCMDFEGWDDPVTNPLHTIRIFTCNGSPTQKWQFEYL